MWLEQSAYVGGVWLGLDEEFELWLVGSEDGSERR